MRRLPPLGGSTWKGCRTARLLIGEPCGHATPGSQPRAPLGSIKKDPGGLEIRRGPN